MKRFLGLLCALTLVFSLGTIGLPSTVLGTLYVRGDFNGWSTADITWDDGTHGDVTSGDGIYIAQVNIALAGRHEFKVADDDWDPFYPASGNSWLYTNSDNEVISFAFFSNSYSDGWFPETAFIQVAPHHDLGGSWTAVGDWQGWNNADPATAMTDQGLGVYALTTQIASIGTYQYKAVITGTWDAIGADGRSVNAVPVDFQITQPGQEVTFYIHAGLGRVKVAVVPEPATVLLFGTGLVGLVGLKKKFKK